MANRFRTFRVVSFGCKVNQTEGWALAERLRGLGLREAGRRRRASPPDGPAPWRSRADLVIVNTCCVTAEAARQGRQRIRRALRHRAAVAVTGCDAHPAAGDTALGQIEGLLALEADKARLLARLTETGLVPAGAEADAAATVGATPSQPRSRAMLKVQDGCPGGCAYCIVPKVRPRVRSLPPAEAVRKAEALVAEGFREIVLCGIHLGLYGADLPRRVPLHDLLARLLTVKGLGRVRLSSILPTEVDGALLALMASEPDRLCPHLHLPLQSGDDEVLRRMGRPYTSAEFLHTVERVRAAMEEPAITTDVLVGFPGETDQALENTLRVCREARFARMHVFPFSRRPGTQAAEMPGRVPGETKQARRRRANELGEELADAYRRRLAGRQEWIAIERIHRDGSAEGLAGRYVRAAVRGPLPEGIARRDLVPVRLDAIEDEALQARTEWWRGGSPQATAPHTLQRRAARPYGPVR